MQHILFRNPGEIDIRGATIAGLSAKETESAIGYFGTGLKYAIAQVLANGGKITIWSGMTEHRFWSEPIQFRGRDHEQIVMSSRQLPCGPSDQQVLGFTTHYGTNWKPWQIFRELYANALDEGGNCFRNPDCWAPLPGHTLIQVEGWQEFNDCFSQRHKIILPANLDYLAASDELRVAEGPTQFVYYKNVRVAKVENALFLWNFKEGLTLTEDRTVEAGSWDLANQINSFIIDTAPEDVVRRFLKAQDCTFENAVYGWMTAPKKLSNCSKDFARVATECFREDPQRFKSFLPLAMAFDPRVKDSLVVQLTNLQTGMLNRAKALVSKMGYEYEVNNIPIVVANLGGKTLGRYADGEITLSPQVFDQGTKQVVSTLYEECVHAKLGFADCTYSMQTHLFNVIISLWEEQLGEPC